MSKLSLLFNTLKHRLFFKREQKQRRQISYTYFGSFLLLNFTLYLAFYHDLQSFATGVSIPQPADPSLIISYATDLSFRTFSSYLVAICLLANLLLIESYALWYTFRAWGWKLRTVISKTGYFVLFQLFYLLPLAILIIAPVHAHLSLQTRAASEVSQMALDLRGKINTPSIAYDLPEIIARLKKSQTPIKLVEGNFTHRSLLAYLDLQEPDTYYRQTILSTAIRDQGEAELDHPAILFPSGELIISSSLSHQALFDLLGELAIHSLKSSSLEKYLQTQKDPSFSFLGEDEYNNLANLKLTQQKAKFKSYLTSTLNSIQENNAYIASLERSLAQLEQNKSAYVNRVNPLLEQCYTEYSLEECQESAQIVAQAVKDFDSSHNQAQVYLEEARSYVLILNNNYQSTKRSYDQFLAFPIIPELQSGIFDPPSRISLKYRDQDDLLPSSYYYTLLHELLHYYSYRPASDLPSFLEEGMTDYLTAEIGQTTADSQYKIDGYPEEILLTQALVRGLGEDQVLELYFGKSTQNWRTSIDGLCGKNCYARLVKLGEQITYTPVDDPTTRADLLTKALELINRDN